MGFYKTGRWDIGAEPDSGTLTLAPYAGFRFVHDKIRIDVDPGRFDDGVRVRKTFNTNAPIVGLDMGSTIHVYASPMRWIHDEK